MANNGNECKEVHHRNVAICGREVVRTHVKKVRKGEKIDDGENNTVYRFIVIGVVLILVVMFVIVYMKNIHLEEENKRLSNDNEKADKRNFSLNCVIVFLFIIIAVIFGSQKKN